MRRIGELPVCDCPDGYYSLKVLGSEPIRRFDDTWERISADVSER